MTSKYGSFSPKKFVKFFCCQNQFSAILRLKKCLWPLSSRGRGKALVVSPLKKDRYFFCGFPKQSRNTGKVLICFPGPDCNLQDCFTNFILFYSIIERVMNNRGFVFINLKTWFRQNINKFLPIEKALFKNIYKNKRIVLLTFVNFFSIIEDKRVIKSVIKYIYE